MAEFVNDSLLANRDAVRGVGGRYGVIANVPLDWLDRAEAILKAAEPERTPISSPSEICGLIGCRKREAHVHYVLESADEPIPVPEIPTGGTLAETVPMALRMLDPFSMNLTVGGPDVLSTHEETDVEMLERLLQEALTDEPRNGWKEWRERVALALEITGERTTGDRA